MLHELKTWPTYFGPVWEGDKTFDVRIDDRGFQKGDNVVLREWDISVGCKCRDTTESRAHLDDCPRYTGRWISGTIGYVLSATPAIGSQRGFNGNGYVVLALLLTEASDPTVTAELQA